MTKKNRKNHKLIILAIKIGYAIFGIIMIFIFLLVLIKIHFSSFPKILSLIFYSIAYVLIWFLMYFFDKEDSYKLPENQEKLEPEMKLKIFKGKHIHNKEIISLELVSSGLLAIASLITLFF